MEIISTEELHGFLERGDPVVLIMAMSDAAFSMGHIPGSINATKASELGGLEDFDVPIVVYCTGPDCAASAIAYRQIVAAGYNNVRHYFGGLASWADAGHPIETGARAYPKTEEDS